MKSPIANKTSKTITKHGDVRVDDYFWLRDKKNSEVIKYLEDENSYTERKMQHTEDLQDRLYKEMKGRIKETDTSAPVKIDNYYYYSRTEEGKQYLIYCRKKDNLNNEEEILLDQNALAKDKPFLTFGVYKVSPDHKKLAYSIDTDGSERYIVYIKDLQTGEFLKENIVNTDYSLEWTNDNKIFFYTILDDSRRSFKVFRHLLGSNPKDDKLVYHEKDDRFFVRISKSRSKRYIFIVLASKITSEVHHLDADDIDSVPQVINHREQEHEYSVDHRDNEFFILTNDNAKNFKLMKTSIKHTTKNAWKEVIGHRSDIMLDSFDIFKDYLVLYELTDGLIKIRIINLNSQEDHYIDFSESVYSADSGSNPEFDTRILRFIYSSLVTPQSTFDYTMDTKGRILVKQKEVLGGYDQSQYVTERIYATAPDGTKIPVSVAYKKGLKLDGSNPCWLYGYGSYGAVMDPRFAENRISLLDRGFVFIIAHIRGGGELGRNWYEDGKYLNKKNTFIDFISCAEHLVKEGYTSKDKLVIHGDSAGGLLIGAVVNMRPDLFHAAIADVPFVDVVNTMLDPTIPLTVLEYEEWGNPDEKKYYEYIRSYSPYDNVKKQDYPHMLVIAGLNDPRVQYWEPAKWVAKLREIKTDKNILILKTYMEHGHSGASGRYDMLKEIAFQYAFAIDINGIRK